MASVHSFPSSQSRSSPRHWPARQASLMVQMSLSSHDLTLGMNTHPLLGVQLSSVQGLASSHTVPPVGVHAPLAQMSPLVHALSSSHAEPSGTVWVRQSPVRESHPAFKVQGLSSSGQDLSTPVQTPLEQISPSVQGFPSTHPSPSAEGGKTQPTSGSQSLNVQGLSSLQRVEDSPAHVPVFWHWSPSVQAFPSSQGIPFSATKEHSPS